MSDYKNGKIYKVVNEDDDIIYIGSTKELLNVRWSKHKLKCDEYKIVLIENYPCENRTELRKMEQKFIEIYIEMGLLNQRKSYRTEEERKKYDKEYKKSDKMQKYHKEYVKEYNKIQEHCPYCEKLMIKKNIPRHIKESCKKKPVDL